MKFPAIPSIETIKNRLELIFPKGTEHRNYLTRDMAVRTIFVMFYAGAIEDNESWIRPSQVTDMTDCQAKKITENDRRYWIEKSLSSLKKRPSNAWYAPNSREPIRDETLRLGFIPTGAIIERKGVATTSSKPKYALNFEFSNLFDEKLSGEALVGAIGDWQKKYLGKGALTRIALIKQGVLQASDTVKVKFPNEEIRMLSPGPSSIIAKEVIEEFASKFLIAPAVLWLSESGNKMIARDESLMKALKIKIDISKNLPDIIIVDLGDRLHGESVKVFFIEVVATDGPVDRERKKALKGIALDAGFEEKQLAFLTAFNDRSSPAFKKTVSEIAWGTYVWFRSEPNELIEFHENAIKFLKGNNWDY